MPEEVFSSDRKAFLYKLVIYIHVSILPRAILNQTPAHTKKESERVIFICILLAHTPATSAALRDVAQQPKVVNCIKLEACFLSKQKSSSFILVFIQR